MSDNKVALKQTGVVGVDPLIDTEHLTVGGSDVERQRIEISGASAAEIARVIQSAPAGSEFGLVVRNVPSGTQDVNVVSGISVTLSAGDIEIGAVEVKNASTDDRLSISAAGAAKVDGSAVTQPMSAASLPLPSGAATEATLDARTGALTEAAPASDTASSGVNGRLQRIAQRITSLIASVLAVAGDVASGATDSGNPVKVGGVARTDLPTAVSAGQRVNAMHDKYGRPVVISDYPDDCISELTPVVITASTAVVTLLAAGASGKRTDFLWLLFTNTSSTVGTEVILYKDDGTTARTHFYVPQQESRGIVFGAHPMIGEGTAKAWKVKTASAVTSLKISGQYATVTP